MVEAVGAAMAAAEAAEGIPVEVEEEVIPAVAAVLLAAAEEEDTLAAEALAEVVEDGPVVALAAEAVQSIVLVVVELPLVCERRQAAVRQVPCIRQA